MIDRDGDRDRDRDRNRNRDRDRDRDTHTHNSGALIYECQPSNTASSFICHLYRPYRLHVSYLYCKLLFSHLLLVVILLLLSTHHSNASYDIYDL